jgi:hypothetical protein
VVTVHGFGSALSKPPAGGKPGSCDCWVTAGARLLFGFETPAGWRRVFSEAWQGYSITFAAGVVGVPEGQQPVAST